MFRCQLNTEPFTKWKALDHLNTRQVQYLDPHYTLKACSENLSNFYLVQGERDVGMNAKHLSQGILVGLRLHVAVQQVLHHVKERGVVVLRFDFI